MKSRETKQKDLTTLTESLQNSKSAMIVSFSKLTVTKDQEFRNSLRDAGANYQVVKNTLARIAVKGTEFEQATDHLKGVTAIAWTDNDPVVLSKAMSKFMKDNVDVYTFKTGVVDGRLIDLTQLTTIANLPSKEELISKLLWVLNSSAERLVTVINAVPRDLAVVIKQIGDAKPGEAPVAEVKAEEPKAEAPVAEAEVASTEEVAAETPAAEVEAAPGEEIAAEAPAAEVEAAPAEEVAAETPAEEVPAAEVEAAPAEEVAAEAPTEDGAETAEETPAAEGEQKAE